MKVEEYPTVTCTKCKCKYSFDKDDIISNKEYIGHEQVGLGWYHKNYQVEEYVECPICGTKHIIYSTKEYKMCIEEEL